MHTGTDARYEEGALESAVDMLLDTELNDEEKPFSATYGPDDLTTSDRSLLRRILQEFLQTEGVQERIERHNISPQAFGGAFILTANGHGAGFWERYGADGQWLTAMVRPYEEINLYVNRRGLLSIQEPTGTHSG